jgi:hypothetical protein
MNIDTALSIKINDTIYNCFMDILTVKSYSCKFNDLGKIESMTFDTVDNNNYTRTYDYENVYDKYMTWESDEEKSWVEWASQNKDFVFEFDHIDTIKNIYKIGFANGFEYRRKRNYEEMMQK